MDSNRFFELLQHSPQWLKWCFSLWGISGAMLAIVLLVFRPVSDTSVNDTKIGAQPISNLAEISSSLRPATLSPSEWLPEQRSAVLYFSKIASLNARFLQRQEFISSMVGRKVVWQGVVEKVFEDSDEIVIYVGVGDVAGRDGFTATYPTTFKAQAFSLQKNDRMEFEGSLSKTVGVLRGTKLKMLPEKQ